MSPPTFEPSPDNTIEVNQNFNTVTLVTDAISALAKHAFTHSINGVDRIYLEDIGAQPSGNYISEGDIRLTDSRNPIQHNLTHFIGGSDPITPSGIGAAELPIKYNDLSDNILDSINIKKRTAKAWVNFNGVGIVSIRSSFNISSITDNGTGDYTINFAVPFSNTNYCFVTWSRDWNADNYIVNNLAARSSTSKTTTGVRLVNNYIANAINYDSTELNIIFFAV